MADTGRIFFWVQHLLGIGHLMRAAHLARYLAAHGWETTVVSGGTPLPDLDIGAVRLHQLPAIKAADSSFETLIDGDGRPLDEGLKSARRDRLLRLFADAEPDILVLEHFPFGRRQFRFELGPLLIAAAQRRARPLVFASVRDILVARKPEREAETVAAVEQVFDGVLVHGDPALVGLEASFDLAPRIAGTLFYTGYIGGTGMGPRPPERDGVDEFIVSAGGGAVGAKLTATALEAARTMPHVRRWRVLVGASAGPRALRKLRAQAPDWVLVEPARPDFRGLLARCAVSISQAGYNTTVDVLASGARAIFVPFAEGRETEQTLRAERLAQRGLGRVLPEASLNAGRLATMVADVMAAPKAARRIKIDGEVEADRLLWQALAWRRGGRG
ncbi:MAG: glycosyltransferase [Rhodospirillaceae bacterium]|nr:glycosyltransferase [Rhodospirillaceae bacterium]